MNLKNLNAIKTLKKLILKLSNKIIKYLFKEFEKNLKHKNFIFSNGIDLIHEFFNIERKINNNILSKSVQFLGKNSSVHNILTKIADKGILY